jgi:hypothetical protein
LQSIIRHREEDDLGSVDDVLLFAAAGDAGDFIART